jgi:hypothetical protein
LRRFYRPYRRFMRRRKRPQQTVVAMARELLGFIWALAHALQAEKRVA